MKRAPLYLLALILVLAWTQNAQPVQAQLLGLQMKRYISAGVTEDEVAIKTTPGYLVSLSARNSNATAKAHIKCVNLGIAASVPGTSTVFYEMIIPAASGFTEASIEAPFDVALTCYLVLGAADNAVDEVAANEVSFNLRYR